MVSFEVLLTGGWGGGTRPETPSGVQKVNDGRSSCGTRVRNDQTVVTK